VSQPTLADLHQFGAPLFVPSGTWWVAGIEGTPTQPDGVVVFGAAGEVEVRTELLTRTPQPLSTRIRNVQTASVNSPDPTIRSQYERVIVDEVERDVSVNGAAQRVRLLASHNSFNFHLIAGGRLIHAAGALEALDTLRIERLDELSLASE
jgi:hypothetical protein